MSAEVDANGGVYLAAKLRGRYLALCYHCEGESCFSINQISLLKNKIKFTL